MKNFKATICLIASLNMFFSQIAFAKTENKSPTQLASENARRVLSKNKKAFSFWSHVRSGFTKKDQMFLDSWFLANPNMSLPEIKVIKVTQSDGTEGYRLLLSTTEKPISVEIKGTDSNQYQVNNLKFTDQDFRTLNTLSNQISENLKIQKFKLSDSVNGLDFEIFSKMSDDEKVMYFINKRLLLESAYQVMNQYSKSSLQKLPSKLELFANLFFDAAYAQNENTRCLTSTGFMGTLNAAQVCEKTTAASKKGPDLFSNLKCSSGKSLCNPLLYGLDRTDSAQGICVSESSAATACAEKSPIKTDAELAALKKSIQSFTPKMGPPEGMERPSGPPPSGSGSPMNGFIEKILKEQNDYIKTALVTCESNPKKDSKQCEELMARQARFNGTLSESVTVKTANASGAPQEERRSRIQSTVADERPDFTNEPEQKGPPKKSAAKDSSCGILCTIGQWISSPTGIITTTVLASWLGYRAGYLSSYRKSQNATVAATANAAASTIISPSAVAPTTPTAPDYTGGVQ